jgi:hypothetical protein
MADLPSILQTCEPRPDVLGGGLADGQFAGQLDHFARLAHAQGAPVRGAAQWLA